MTEPDRMIWRRDLRAACGGVSDETLRKWMRAGKLPEPDVDLSNRTRGWKLSSLQHAGLAPQGADGAAPIIANFERTEEPLDVEPRTPVEVLTNYQGIPPWLQPYKNDWLTMGRMAVTVQPVGKPFAKWFESIRPRLRVITEPSRAHQGLMIRRYLVKQVWAFSRTHGLQLREYVGDPPPPTESQVVAELQRALHAAGKRPPDIVRVEKEVIRNDAADVKVMELLLRSTEPRPQAGVYFLFGPKGEVLYIGQSNNVLGRMAGHAAKAFHSVKMVHVAEDSERKDLERRLIGIFRPCLNVQGITRILEAA